MSQEVIRESVVAVLERLASGDYSGLVAQCSGSRLSADDVRNVVAGYGRTVIVPPHSVYEHLDLVPVKAAPVPTWSVRMPIWTKEEGRSDLTLELTISLEPSGPRVELDDLRVP